MVELIYRTAALKRLAQMPKPQSLRMTVALEKIAADPTQPHPQVKKLVGKDNTYRLRVGDWRAVYELHWADDIMSVIVIDVRGSVYR